MKATILTTFLSLFCFVSSFAQEADQAQHLKKDLHGNQYLTANGKLWVVRNGRNMDPFYTSDAASFHTLQPCNYSAMMPAELRGKRKEVVDYAINHSDPHEVIIAYQGNNEEVLFKSKRAGNFNYLFMNITPKFIKQYDGIVSVEGLNNENQEMVITLTSNKILTRFSSKDGGMNWEQIP